MRVVREGPGAESRDCLAQDWAPFLAAALPGVSWLPVPNLGSDVLRFVEDWNLDGFILTGGNDLQECPLRDETETTILQHAVEQNLPVFGVCRGLQLIQSFFGGPVRPCPQTEHVGVQHIVRVTADPGRWEPPLEIRTVNSFHTQAVPIDDVPSALRVFAVSQDGWAEGLVHVDAPITAVQWHPERMQPYESPDRALVQELFKYAA